VLEVARMIWHKKKGREATFRYVCDPPFEYDVQRRIPAVEKAKTLLGFEATTTLDEMLDEVIPWVEKALADGLI
jgi:UDP-glucose 4-epimerase